MDEQEILSKNEIPKKNIEDEWFKKVNYFVARISKMEKGKDRATKVSSFLLKCQFVEFVLKKLIRELYRYAIEYKPSVIFDLSKKSGYIDGLTFGQTINFELKNFFSPEVLELIPNLQKLNSKRTQLNHKLFEEKSTMKEIDAVAQEGILLMDIILNQMNKLLKIVRGSSKL